MQTLIKWLAIFLTFALVLIVYAAIACGMYTSSTFWVIYIAIVLLDLKILKYLNTQKKAQDR